MSIFQGILLKPAIIPTFLLNIRYFAAMDFPNPVGYNGENL